VPYSSILLMSLGSPYLVSRDSVQLRVTDPISATDLFRSNSVRMVGADLGNCFIRVFAVTIQLAASPDLADPPLSDFILSVVAIGSSEKVVRIEARGIIAAMADYDFLWDDPVNKSI
jgi:hypothetical protein